MSELVALDEVALAIDNSLNETEGRLYPNDDIISWIEAKCDEVEVQIQKTSLSKLKQWRYSEDTGIISHQSGKFFTIEGRKFTVYENDNPIKNWYQPIIVQPEIGILGCITKIFDDVMYFLVQAKIEPGNKNLVQISPTLQATKSNYSQVHKGTKPKFLEYFIDNIGQHILFDQLQSEQGARFFKKRNRNMIIVTKDDITLNDDFRWITLGQIKHLLKYDNVINMDLRTVISAISYQKKPLTQKLQSSTRVVDVKKSLFDITHNGNTFNRLQDTLNWLSANKAKTEILTQNVSLSDLQSWSFDDTGIRHQNDKFFDILWVNVLIKNREVQSWDQPILAPKNTGIIAFIVKKIDNNYHFLCKADVECGNFDSVEIGPTIACDPLNHPINKIPFYDYIINVREEQILYDAIQSEEGGRFYLEENRNLIVEADESFPSEIPNDYHWISFTELLYLVKFNNVLNIGTRSLIAAVTNARLAI